jgi:hypothetical protein
LIAVMVVARQVVVLAVEVVVGFLAAVLLAVGNG